MRHFSADALFNLIFFMNPRTMSATNHSSQDVGESVSSIFVIPQLNFTTVHKSRNAVVDSDAPCALHAAPFRRRLGSLQRCARAEFDAAAVGGRLLRRAPAVSRRHAGGSQGKWRLLRANPGY